MNTRSKGNVGEDIACKFLRDNGFTIIARNYMRKWGELDIVAQKDSVLHFVEVKSITYKDGEFLDKFHQPEENVHNLKLRKIGRMIQTFIAEREEKVTSETRHQEDFFFHVICVYMNIATRRAHVKWIKNVIL